MGVVAAIRDAYKTRDSIPQMVTRPCYILKLGGSVITFKAEGKPRLNTRVVDRLVDEINRAHQSKPFDLILICGVGSIGHTRVIKWDINNGVYTPAQKKGVKLTLVATRDIAFHLQKKLAKVGIKAKEADASKLFKQKNKRVTYSNVKAYVSLLKKGIVPISTGSMVKDSAMGWSVLSGDQIIAQLAQAMKPTRILLGTDVSGIFTADPKTFPRAKRIPLVSTKNVDSVLKKVGESKSVDVTQGMKGKLDKLAQTVRGTPALIFSLNEPGNLFKVLSGKKVKGTIVRL